MSKELDALIDLSKLVFIYGGVEQYQIIEKALKRLERYDNSHLVALPRISGKSSLMHDYIKAFDVLQIIKEKLSIYVKKDRDLGFMICCNEFGVPVSEEEFDLLKEVLEGNEKET